MKHKDQPVYTDGKLIVTGQPQQDILANLYATLGAPVPPEHRKQMPLPPIPEVNFGRFIGDSFSGFTLPAGTDRALVVLHPEHDADGNLGDAPQVLLAIDNEEWVTWGREVVSYGLTVGNVPDKDGALMSGFAATAVNEQTGAVQTLGFLFTQIAAILPFKDIDEATAKGKLKRQHERMAEERKQEKKRLRAKAARVARKKNRK